MSDVKLVILGAGGHGKVCAEIASELLQYQCVVFSDNAIDRGTQILQWAVEYHDDDLPRLDRSFEFIIGMGQTEGGAKREQLYGWLQRHQATIATLVSRNAFLSPSASIGPGTVIGHMALVQASATVGANCIINSGAVVEHDSKIGSHVHVSTGSIVNGGTIVGDRCLIGSSAVLNQAINICADTIIGSGAVVTSSIDEPGVYVGIPARRVRDVR